MLCLQLYFLSHYTRKYKDCGVPWSTVAQEQRQLLGIKAAGGGAQVADKQLRIAVVRGHATGCVSRINYQGAHVVFAAVRRRLEGCGDALTKRFGDMAWWAGEPHVPMCCNTPSLPLTTFRGTTG